MKSRTTRWCVIWTIVGCQASFSQVTTTSVPFLLVAPDARTSGMGESGVALSDNVWATYWNPAAYAFQAGMLVAADYAYWQPSLNPGDMWLGHTVYAQGIQDLHGTVSAMISYFSQGEIGHTLTDATVVGTFHSYDFAITLGYSTKISDVWGMGFNVRLIRSVLSPFGVLQDPTAATATGLSFDFGMLFHPAKVLRGDILDRFSFGFNLSNIGPKLTYRDNSIPDPIPTNLRFGLAFKFLESKENNITLVGDFDKLLVNYTNGNPDGFIQGIFTSWTKKTFSEELGSFDTGLGFEYWYGYPKLIGLRTGYFYEDPRYGNRKFLTFGLGLSLDSYGFDFSYAAASQRDNPVGGTLRFSLSGSFGHVDH